MEQNLRNGFQYNDGSVDTRSPRVNSNMSREITPSAAKALFPGRDFDREASYEKALNMLRGFITADAERTKIKWNFDIINDRPLDGAIEWEKGDDRYHWIGSVSGGSNGMGENGKINTSINGEKSDDAIIKAENGIET